ncbi:DAK2 domain-containing protein [Nesterenkonia marinintestina]|uniref:DAK2 domain-containing protein n=1 Tax=Nesterenkonia marinintestina TaxID=2979865 RepID=UPI0021C1115F|nr:DAK2 domain-containing protein [Nesterenkonia sp. GX14115]
MAKRRFRGRAAMLRWFDLSEQALGDHRTALNRLNVFPVPDSDTGDNMLATAVASRRAAAVVDSDDFGELLAGAGAEAMVEARGNSGTLLAVLLTGLAAPLRGCDRLTITTFAAALDSASVRAWSALSGPVSGTMLSIIDAVRDLAARRAAEVEEPESRAALEDALPEVVAEARRAVEATESQLDALRTAGVVDSGGTGLLLVFDALRAAVRGEDLTEDLLDGLHGVGASARHRADDGGARRSGAQEGPADPDDDAACELMATVRLDPLGAAGVRHRLDELGDSVIVTPVDSEPEGDGTYRWRIHVHTEEPEAAREALAAAGRLEGCTVSPLHSGGAAR